ncbi:hypothetical protein DFJ43DRAFT_1224811 [Lentinula guzmanii]|uniref:Uncharacterized protein n=1 Tax=Lentinula guzmanii TaxID=2804957 RepID=A0AA38JAF6_9AGAR|nr:hypothetical protein DFJ43DRAFT_1224811 [Lentinula guzmanii]
MRLRPSITSHCILSVYLLSAAFLSIVVVANPIPIPRRTTDGKDIRIRLAWRILGVRDFEHVSNGFEAVDRFTLFMTGTGFSAGFEFQDSKDPSHARLVQVALPLAPSQTITEAVLKDFATDGKRLMARFIDGDFFFGNYAVIRNVDRLRTETNTLLKKKKVEEYKDFTIGDPEFQDEIDIIRDDLDWINTVLLYLTLINQPERKVPVLAPQDLVGWTVIFEEMTKETQTHRKVTRICSAEIAAEIP